MRYFIHLCYRGTFFHGWQRQKNAYTIQEEVENALKTFLQEDISTVGCGRTDSGVHARSYYLHFDSDRPLNQRATYALNSLLSDDISVLDIMKSKKDIHARFSALTRTYQYFIHHHKDPFMTDRSYLFHRKDALDIDLMNEFCQQLLKVESFYSFEKKGSDNTNSNCSVSHAQWSITDNGCFLKITSNRFLRNMVRAIVATSLMIGTNKRTLEDVMQDVMAQKPIHLSMAAPACGLHLWSIEYPENVFKKL